MHEQNSQRHPVTSIVGGFLAGVALIAASGCGSDRPAASAPAVQSILATPVQGPGQEVFASDQDACKALIEVARTSDKQAMRRLLGPADQELVSGDPVEDANAFKKFVEHANERTRLDKLGDSKSVVCIGKNDWPFPIPIVCTADGKWFFDTEAGKTEILARRIGANELNTMEVCRAYVAAQREYASRDRDGSGVLKYAQHMVSKPGQKDGLYWEAAPGEEQSPLGPLAAEAALEGYQQTRGHGPHPYHGYYFHILRQQGPAAAGGRYNYVINGNMIAGFALVAYPAQYGSSGIMSFIVSHRGTIYQKDLGPETQRNARAISEYNPDSSWTLVKD